MTIECLSSATLCKSDSFSNDNLDGIKHIFTSEGNSLPSLASQPCGMKSLGSETGPQAVKEEPSCLCVPQEKQSRFTDQF